MRCVFLGQVPGQGISRHGTQERRDKDQPAPPPEHCCVILEAQLSVFSDFSMFLWLCDPVISPQRGGDASSNRRRLGVAPSSSRTRIAPCHTKCQKLDLKRRRRRRRRPRSDCSYSLYRMSPATSATNPCSPSSMARLWAATKGLEGSHGCWKPSAAETWLVPRSHQLERQPTAARALQTARGADVL